jgi:hypothetical protein
MSVSSISGVTEMKPRVLLPERFEPQVSGWKSFESRVSSGTSQTWYPLCERVMNLYKSLRLH